MTVQMPKLPDATLSTLVVLAPSEPPVAPLAMPKQTLTAEPGLLRRAFAAMTARVMPSRPSLNRAD